MQAWLNTSSSVSQTRSPWHLGSIPVAQGRELARGPLTLLLNTPNPQVYCLSSQWWLPFVRKHNSSGQSLPAACAPSQRHTVYNPLYSLARSLSPGRWLLSTGSEQERALVTTRIPAFRDENNRAHSLAACRPLRHQSDARSHENKALLLGYFYRKSQWGQASSGGRCSRWERSCCHNDFRNTSLQIGQSKSS